jgi:Phosphatidylinositol 3- and 4-kinase
MSRFAETVLSETPKTTSLGEGKFSAMLAQYPNGEKGILKAVPFATDKFRGIPKQELPRREVAAYVLDRDVLDFGVVPETVLTRYEDREASVQKFCTTGLMPRDVVPGLFNKNHSDWKYRIAKLFARINLDDMLRTVVLDLVMNNVDRHGRNVLVDRIQKKVWAIDNGLAFGRYYSGYRNIFHKYLYFARLPVPEWLAQKLGRIEEEDLGVLEPYLPPECIQDTWLRIQFILEHRDRLAYKRMGALQDFTQRHFPSYEEWFKRQTQQENDDTALVYSPAANVDATVG